MDENSTRNMHRISPVMFKVHAAARRERGADSVQLLVPALRFGTRSWTGTALAS